MTTIALRFLISTILILLFLPLAKQGLKMSLWDYKLFSLLIVSYVVVSACLYKAFELLPAGLAILFFYAYPALTAIVNYLINKEKLKRENSLALVVSALGLVMLLWSSWSGVNLWGVFLALGGALANAIYLVYAPKMLRQVNQLTWTAWLFIASLAIYWPMGLVSGTISFNFAVEGWFYLLALCLISTIAATLALLYGLPLVGPTEAAIVHTVEPPVTAFLAYLVFREVLSGFQLLGAVLILAAVLLPQLLKKPEIQF